MISSELEGIGAVLVQGPKWCGKTTTCEQVARSALYMSDPKHRASYLQMAQTDVSELLAGEKPRLIDEWQDAPQLWDAIRHDVDHAEGYGRYILTGSAVPADINAISHSGTGRFAWITMRTMSLWESHESSGRISLADQFNSAKDFKSASVPEKSLREIAFMLCRGGWPQAVIQGGANSLRRAFNYFDAVVNMDISRVDSTMRAPDRVKRLMRSYARLQGSQSGLKAIKLDIMANGTDPLDEDTVSSYLKALRRIFVVEDMPAWCPSLHNKAVIRTTETRYFSDPSIATAALGIGPEDLMQDLRTFGLLFETMAVRDLRCYADAIDGTVSHFHDGSGLECDAVIHLRNGAYGLVEVKLGGEALIKEGTKALLSLANKIDTIRMKPPAFKMIVVATGNYAYRTTDDVLVVPIAALRP